MVAIYPIVVTCTLRCTPASKLTVLYCSACAAPQRISMPVPQHVGLLLVTDKPCLACAENQWQQDGEVL